MLIMFEAEIFNFSVKYAKQFRRDWSLYRVMCAPIIQCGALVRNLVNAGWKAVVVAGPGCDGINILMPDRP